MIIPTGIWTWLLTAIALMPQLGAADLGPELILKEDQQGPFAEYRMKPGDTLYDHVVKKYCKPRPNGDLLPVAEAIMARSGFKDAAKIRIGACVRIPLDLLLDPYRPRQATPPPTAEKSLGPDPIDALFKELKERSRRMLDRDREREIHWEDLSRLFPVKGFPSGRWDAQTFRLEMERQLLKSDPGVNAIALYQSRNADDLVGLDNASESTAYIGLEWWILGNGWWENRLKAKDLDQRAAVDARTRQSQERAAFHPVLYNEVVYNFNREHIRRLGEILAYLDDFIALSRGLYHYRLVTWEDLLELGRKRAKYQSLMEAYERYNSAYRCTNRPWPLELDVNDLPVVDVLLDNLQATMDDDPLCADLITLNHEQTQKRQAWLRDLRLRLFVRQEYRHDEDGDDHPVVFGVSARAPLRWTRRSRQAEREARLTLDAVKLWDTKDQAMREVLNEYFEYRYHLTDFHTLALREQRLAERLRKSKLRRDLHTSDFNPLDLIQQTLEREELHFEWLDKKRLLYQSLVQIYRWSNPVDLVPHLAPAETRTITRYQGRRAAYIWSKTLRTRSPEFIAGYLEKNEIGKAYLSYSQKVGPDKLERFREALSHRGIQVYWLIGDNNLLFDENHPLDFPLEGVSGLHIDVEPHALDAWKERREPLTAAYLRLLDRFAEKTRAAGKRLEVAVPVHYSPELLQAVAPLADEVTLMAYGGADLPTLERRLKEEREILRGKWRLAVSCKDFRDRFDMEHYLMTTDGALRVGRFAIHDLAGLIELDNRDPGMEDQP